MKKAFVLLVCLLVGCGLVACGGKAPESAVSEVLPDSATPTFSGGGQNAVAEHGFVPPEGFAERPEQPGTYYSPDYPGDASNICLAVDVHDPYFEAYDAALMQEAQRRALTAQLGEEVAVTVDDFSYFTLDGLPAWQLKAHYTADGRQVRQLTVSVNADSRYTYTFTQVDTDDWDEAFAQSAGSLWFAVG